MKELPIRFLAPMVRAILEGRKTQTRRVVNPQPNMMRWHPVQLNRNQGWEDEHGKPFNCPYGIPGDRLHVKEGAWMFCERRPNGKTKTGRQKWRYVPLADAPILYAVETPKKPTIEVAHPITTNQWEWRYKTARFLPRWASRITLLVKSVRVERLQTISEEGAIAEGICIPDCIGLSACGGGCDSCESTATHKDHFRNLWQSLNGKRPGCSWKENPWVWVVEFERTEKEPSHG